MRTSKHLHWLPAILGLAASMACATKSDPSGVNGTTSAGDKKGGGGDMSQSDCGQPQEVVSHLRQMQIASSETDANLVNTWGLSFSKGGRAWLSDNGTGLASVYASTGPLFTVTIPAPPGAMGPSAPTGNALNDMTADFLGDRVIFVTEDGTIAGYDGRNTVLRVDNSASGAVYKGLALLSSSCGHDARLYAANFNAGTVDVFDEQYQPVTATAPMFVDPTLPPGFAPFNILSTTDGILVSYALQNDEKHDDVAGPGNGFLDLFDADGNLLTRLVSQGPLNSPWGMAMAPDGFGELSRTLLVGDFGDGHINVFRLHHEKVHDQDPVRAEFLGIVGDGHGEAIMIDGLWALVFGPGAGGFGDHTLYFTAGPMKESQGLFGSLSLP